MTAKGYHDGHERAVGARSPDETRSRRRGTILGEFALQARKAMWGRGSRVDWFYTDAQDSDVRRKLARRLTSVETPVEVNQRGFMRDLSEWTPEAAKFLARQEGHPNASNELVSDHWRVIDYVRSHYHPALHSSNGARPSLESICEDLNLTKKRFLELFPGGVKSALRISGLPGPRRSANGTPLSGAQRLRAGDWWTRLTC
jgi:tRNA 2-thiouridine synthesizing protein E